MDVSNLPAVQDATSYEGIFSRAVRREEGASLAGAGRFLIQMAAGVGFGLVFAAIGLLISQVGGYFDPFNMIIWGLAGGTLLGAIIINKVLHPNVQLAKEILKSGTIPLDKIGPALKARNPSIREQIEIDNAIGNLASQGALFFDGCFVLPSSFPYALTFGSYLFLSRGVIERENLDCVIAHELGHLNNGDSFVKCALWALGKGWTREYMELSGKVAEPATDGKGTIPGVVTIGIHLGRKNWQGAVVEAALMSIASTGSSLKGMEEEMRVFFSEWDIEADIVAETLIDPWIYQGYLQDQADFEQGSGTLLLSAQAELRYDSSLMRW